MALGKIQKVHGIVHASAASAAGVGAGLAQLPGSDAVPLCGIQTAMIMLIAKAHGCKLPETKAAQSLGAFSAAMFGRKVSQVLVGWVPAWGNAINATTAAAITEGVGWAAHAYFENLGEEPPLGQEGFPAARTRRIEPPVRDASGFGWLARASSEPARAAAGVLRRAFGGRRRVAGRALSG